MTHAQTTGIKTIQLDRNEETRLLYLDSELTYPVLISVNLLVTTPNKPPAAPPAHANASASAENALNDAEISTIGATKTIANNNNVSSVNANHSDNDLLDLENAAN